MTQEVLIFDEKTAPHQGNILWIIDNKIVRKWGISRVSIFFEYFFFSVTLVKSSGIYTGQYTFPILLLNDGNVLGEHKGRQKEILSTEVFFRKSTFCILVDTNPGFDGHWVMPEIFLLNGTCTILEMTAFLLKTFLNSMHWFK